jgi:uncharacterized protein with HEPN domain/predicted nucleotidyltransferase
LFGSVLRPQDFRADSDLDVLVEFEAGHVPGFAFVDLANELSVLVGRPVDLHTPASLSPEFRDAVLREAEVLYGATAPAWCRSLAPRAGAASKEVAYVDGYERAILDTDEMRALALVRLPEIVGEAARAVSDPTRDHYPTIPWRQIAGTRDRLIHRYEAVDARHRVGDRHDRPAGTDR